MQGRAMLSLASPFYCNKFENTINKGLHYANSKV